MQCRETMDKASAKLSRARSALKLAMKVGPEATKGELLDAISTALELIDAADAALGEERTEAQAGHSAPAHEAACQPRLVSDNERRAS